MPSVSYISASISMETDPLPVGGKSAVFTIRMFFQNNTDLPGAFSPYNKVQELSGLS